MPQFDPTHFVSQIFWMLICFFILVIVMTQFAVPRIQKGIHKRANYLQDLKNLEGIYLTQIDELTERMNTLKQEHHDKTKHRIDKVHLSLLEEKEAVLHKLQEDFEKARHLAREATAKEMNHLRAEIPSIAKELASLLLQNTLVHSSSQRPKKHVLS